MRKTTILFPVMVLMLLATALTACNSNKEQDKALASQTVSKDSADISAKDAENDSIEELTPKEAAKQDSLQTKVFMGLWGNIGDECYVFDMNGTTGDYIHWSMEEGKEYGERRQLQLVSYDPSSGLCIINAYLKGEYIGQFNGIFEEDEVQIDEETTHLLQSYNGTFTNAKGSKVAFTLYYD